MSDQLTWDNFHASTLPENEHSKLSAWQAAEKAAYEAKKAFELALIERARKTKKIGQGQTIVFSYNFLHRSGTIGYAVKMESAEKPKPKSEAKLKSF